MISWEAHPVIYVAAIVLCAALVMYVSMFIIGGLILWRRRSRDLMMSKEDNEFFKNPYLVDRGHDD